MSIHKYADFIDILNRWTTIQTKSDADISAEWEKRPVYARHTPLSTLLIRFVLFQPIDTMLRKVFQRPRVAYTFAMKIAAWVAHV